MENYSEETSGVREDSSYTNIIKLLLKAGQGDQISPEGWWRIRNLIRYQE